jgi:hypothetical protein
MATRKGRKKGDAEDDRYEDEFVDCVGDNAAMLDQDLQLVAGTAWLFSRKELDRHVDTLFLDEGGQVSLADAIAVGTAAKNLVLLGDPNQLPQVSQGSHPPGADASVLAQLLGDDQTVRPEMGLFLEKTWRMRKEVCDYISDTFYEGRLGPESMCAERSVELGNGVRFLAVEHSGHRQASPEEAGVVAAELERLLGTPYHDEDGARTLPGDSSSSPRTTRTSAACASTSPIRGSGSAPSTSSRASRPRWSSTRSRARAGRTSPRGLDFLLSRNRLNVAISRAKCLVYLVCSPRLLEVDCKTVEQMRLANALCRLVEVADPS